MNESFQVSETYLSEFANPEDGIFYNDLKPGIIYKN